MKKCIWICFLVLMMASLGCGSKKVTSTSTPEQEPQQEVQEPQPEPQKEKKVSEPAPAEPTPMELYADEYAELPTQHKVQKGECLWWIAEYKEVYNDPFMWPLIYKANRGKIQDPDLIYPDQVFSIPRDFSKNQLTDSRRQAGAPKPYLPPQEANMPADLRSELGWGF